jgi:hypothetical protein
VPADHRAEGLTIIAREAVVHRQGALGAAAGEVDRGGVDAAAAQPLDVRRHARRRARGAVGEQEAEGHGATC